MADTKAGAGRGFLNPQRTDESDESYITPKVHYEMRKEQLQGQENKANEEAYNKAIGKKKGGTVRSSASKRADGIAVKGHTRGRYM
jgi:hypothetical protein